jgi:GTPase SAR1 family protein
MPISLPSIKIVVIGDCGVGKSSLSKRIEKMCTNSNDQIDVNGFISDTFIPLNPYYNPTIGCDIHVVAVNHPNYGKYFVELWDVGGNPTSTPESRQMFYDDCEGVIFLWDSSSERTYHSLGNINFFIKLLY